MLPIGGRLRVDALDRSIDVLDDARQLHPGAGTPPFTEAVGPREQTVALFEERPRRLVRFDPRRRRARIPQHPMGERPLPGGRIVFERESLALVRQVVERPLLAGLADLALDERFAHELA